MARELAGSQISALLEAVPGIANVLRSPVADALVHMIRAGAGLEDFQLEYAKELTQYAERRGLVGANEAEELLSEVSVVAGRRRGASRVGGTRRPAKASRSKPKAKARPKPRPKPASGKKLGAPAKRKAAKRETGGPVKKAAKRRR